MNNEYILCKSVIFHSPKDEDAFFEWIKSIECIEKFEGARDELYLDLVSKTLTSQDLKELIALLYRYNIEMTQLARFLTDENKAWFYDNKKAFWHKKVFPQNTKI